MKILILGDIHGRDFWIEPCKHIDEFDKVIFLGDYHDPYPYQVSQKTSRHRLRDKLVPFIESHKDKVICLLGNHDRSYLVEPSADRFDRQHAPEIKKYLKKMNLQLIYQIDGYLFSHSGVLPKWLENNNLDLSDLETLPFNHSALMDISSYRGGFDYGSCIWGDVIEYMLADKLPDLYQIFGHTQLKSEVIVFNFACLDCRKAFVLDTKTKSLKAWEEKS